jgi:hypothetical protein
MTRPTAIALVLGLLAACGGERAPARSRTAARSQVPPAAEALPPEVARLLLQGPGGPAADDGFQLDLEGDRPIALRIVLDSPAR